MSYRGVYNQDGTYSGERSGIEWLLYDDEGVLRFMAIGGVIVGLTTLIAIAALGVAIPAFLDADKTQAHRFCTDQVKYEFGYGANAWEFSETDRGDYVNYARIHVMRIDDDVQVTIQGIPYNTSNDGVSASPEFDLSSVSLGSFAIHNECIPSVDSFIIPDNTTLCSPAFVLDESAPEPGNRGCGIWSGSNASGIVSQSMEFLDATIYNAPSGSASVQLWYDDAEVLYLGGMAFVSIEATGSGVLSQWTITMLYKTNSGRNWNPPTFCRIENCYNGPDYIPDL